MQSIEFIDLKTQYHALRGPIHARMQKVLDHGQFIMGPEVKELEDHLGTYTGSKHCLTVASGTEALLISLMALGVGPGDEVVTTPFSFIATAEVVAMLGATPVFVDIEADTCNINAQKIQEAISPRTRAIMPVGLYGQPADMDEINEIAASHGLAVIEDAAQSFGALYKGRKSCNLSTIGCTSFFPSKPLGCYGDGGAIFTNDDVLAKAMREIRVHGQERRYYHTRVGVGGRMDTLQCAIVLAKLERFDWEIERRIEIGKRYFEMFAAFPAPARVVTTRPDRTNVHAQYTLAVPDRAALQAGLTAAGIPTAVHYPVPMHLQPAYAHLCDADACPVAVKLATEVISLPIHADLDRVTQERIAQTVIALLNQNDQAGNI